VQEAGGVFANFKGTQNSIRGGTALVGNTQLVKELRKRINATKTR